MRTGSRPRALASAGLLAGALVLAACADGDDPTVGSAGDSGTSATSVELDDRDVSFLQGMVPHHAQAVAMAEAILEKEPSEPVRALAERIRAAQDPEIDHMNGMLAEAGEEPVGAGHGGHGSGTDTAEHGGMMSEDQMRQLREAGGTEAERLFLRFMIEHHRGAIASAEEQIAEGRYEPARVLAQQIRADQQAEISEMEQLLGQL
jgi:uncharacterized protein (DUF305 family)